MKPLRTMMGKQRYKLLIEVNNIIFYLKKYLLPDKEVNYEIAKYLIDHDVDINLKAKDDKSILEYLTDKSS